MKTVIPDVRTPADPMADFARVWKTGKPERSAQKTSGVDYLITGDKDLLAMADRYPIADPAKFWATHAGL